MKRILAVLLCLALVFSITACKPDNITYPVEIVDPDASEETPEQQEEQPEETPETETEQPEDSTAGEATDAAEDTQEDPAEQETEETEQDTEETAEEPELDEPETDPAANPLAAETFKPSTGAASALTASGIIKPGSAVSALKNRTISIYTAGDQPAFAYTDETGNTVNEWQWMEKIAAENGFILKYSIKSKAISLKAQRIALYAGKKLSLVQMGVDELADGMTLAGSAADFLDTAARSFGISKAVLEQSDYKLFAPVGNIDSLWYNANLMPEDSDPQAMSKSNQWTVEKFKAVCSSASEGVLPLIMDEILPWATLSGRSPLTLLEGKLDSNINAGVTREVWAELKELDLNTLRNAEGGNDYSLDKGSTLFAYTDAPKTEEGVTLKYAPLPSVEEGTAGTVTYAGTFFALPKYEEDEESIRAALTFAELWCNRYTEARAATLQTLGVSGSAYQEYCDMAEANGHLILHSAAIETTVADYLSGLTDAAVDMDEAYEAARDKVDALIAAKNLYY